MLKKLGQVGILRVLVSMIAMFVAFMGFGFKVYSDIDEKIAEARKNSLPRTEAKMIQEDIKEIKDDVEKIDRKVDTILSELVRQRN